MATKYFIRQGAVKSNQPARPSGNVTGPNAPFSNGDFDLHRWLRNELAFLNVMQFDPCCDAAETFAPTRYNVTTGHIQFLNPSNATWTQAVL